MTLQSYEPAREVLLWRHISLDVNTGYWYFKNKESTFFVKAI